MRDHRNKTIWRNVRASAAKMLGLIAAFAMALCLASSAAAYADTGTGWEPAGASMIKPGVAAQTTSDCAPGDLYTFGDNQFGQLGNGETTNRSTPAKIAGSVASVSLGSGHSVYVTESGDLYTCGFNHDG